MQADPHNRPTRQLDAFISDKPEILDPGTKNLRHNLWIT